MDKKRDWGWLFLLFILAAIFGVAKGCSSATAISPLARNPLDVLDELFTHAICLVPLLSVFVPLLILGIVRLYFFVQAQRLELRRRRAEVAHVERSVPQVQMGLDGRGQLVLVDPRLATRAVTPVAAADPADSEKLRAAALLANAAKRGAMFPGLPNLETLPVDTAPRRPETVF